MKADKAITIELKRDGGLPGVVRLVLTPIAVPSVQDFEHRNVVSKRVACLFKGIAKAIDPFPVGVRPHFKTDDVAAIRSDLAVVTAGLSRQFKEKDEANAAA